MLRFIILFLIIGICFSETFADTAVQTDWSGGPGILGPVTAFGSVFSSDTDVKWCSCEGYIELNYQQNLVTDNFDNYHSSFAADVDGDGDIDVLTGKVVLDGSIKWYENMNGFGTLFSEHSIADIPPYGITCLYVDDIDGDNDMDILYGRYVSGVLSYVEWIENRNGSGTQWLLHTIDYSLDHPASLCSEDVDGDGDRDVIVAASTGDEIVWFENTTGTGYDWEKHSIDDNFRFACSVCSKDIDGDGDLDVLGAASYDDEIAWWENIDGLGLQWLKHVVKTDFMWASSVHSEDVDSDGDSDIIGSSLNDDEIILWLNQNSVGTLWTECIIDNDFNGASSVYSGDFDGDNDIDIIAGSQYYSYVDPTYRIIWWENCIGSDTEWIKHTILDNYGGVNSVFSADFNGDGIADILAGSAQNDVISWWNVVAYSSNGLLESSILDTECSPQWASMDWSSSEPAGTDLYFQYKTSDDPGNMGSWSDTISVPCYLSGLLDRYFQYRVSMETDDPCSTPTLHDVSLNWDPVGIEVGEDPAVLALLPFSPNPSSLPAVRFSLPEPAYVDISIFDLSGRLVRMINGEEYSPGYHYVLLGEFSPGIYFCRMISGDFAATQRLIVIE